MEVKLLALVHVNLHSDRSGLVIGICIRNRSEVDVALRHVEFPQIFEADADLFGIEDVAVRDRELVAKLVVRKSLGAGEADFLQAVLLAFVHTGGNSDCIVIRTRAAAEYVEAQHLCFEVAALLERIEEVLLNLVSLV